MIVFVQVQSLALLLEDFFMFLDLGMHKFIGQLRMELKVIVLSEGVVKNVSFDE